MGRFTIEQASIGYDTVGLQDYINKINTQVVNGLIQEIHNSIPTLRTIVDDVWVGVSAEAFKDRLEDDSNTIINTLGELEDLVESEMAQMASNVDTYDGDVAEAILSGDFSGISYNTSSSSSSGIISKKETFTKIVQDENTTRFTKENNSLGSKVLDVLGSVGATVGVAGTSLVEGIVKFGESIVDAGAIVGTALLTPITGIVDAGKYIYSSLTGTEFNSTTSAMWDNTMSFVATDYTTGWFDSFYENTSVGQTLKENAYGFDTVRSVGCGVGQVVGTIALTVLTAGVGGALTGASSGAISASQLAVTAGVSGFGKGTEKSWGEGANAIEGLTYGVASGAWEGLQYYTGAKIGGLSAFNNQAANIATRIGLDTLDSGVEGFVQPALSGIYKDGTYAELFDEAGGWANVGTQAAIGGFGSLLGETSSIKKLFTDTGANGTTTNLTETIDFTAKDLDNTLDLSTLPDQVNKKIDTDVDFTPSESNIVKDSVEASSSTKMTTEEFVEQLKQSESKGTHASLSKEVANLDFADRTRRMYLDNDLIPYTNVRKSTSLSRTIDNFKEVFGNDYEKYGSTDIPTSMVMDASDVRTFGSSTKEAIDNIAEQYGTDSIQALTARGSSLQEMFNSEEIVSQVRNLDGASYREKAKYIENIYEQIGLKSRELTNSCKSYGYSGALDLGKEYFSDDIEVLQRLYHRDNLEECLSLDPSNKNILDEALIRYTGSEYRNQNNILRDSTSKYLDDTNVTDPYNINSLSNNNISSINKILTTQAGGMSGMSEQTILYRGISNLDWVGNGALKSAETSEQLVDAINNLGGGTTTIGDNAFASSTPVLGSGFTNKEWNTTKIGDSTMPEIVEVTSVPKGTEGAYIATHSSSGGETEYLLQAGTGNRKVILGSQLIDGQVFVFTQMISE